jgi:hypothetical protein
MEIQQQEEDTTSATPRQSRAVVGSVNLEQVTWDDIAADSEGQAITVSGHAFALLSARNLRTLCSRLSIRGIKNIKKNEMVEKIVTTYQQSSN